MSIEKDKKPRKAPAKKAAATGDGVAKKAVTKPNAAAAGTKAAPKAKAAAKSASAAGVPEVAAKIAKSRPTHMQIAELAHSYYLQRGGQHGYHEQDWLRAERDLLSGQ